MNKSTVTVGVISAVAGGIVGGVVTYVTVNRKLRTRYEDWANLEIDEVKRHYAELNSETKLSFIQQAENPSESALEIGRQMMERLGYIDAKEEEESHHPTSQTLSIFDQGVDEEEARAELESEEEAPSTPEEAEAYLKAMDRGYEVLEGEPFLISEAEYFENEPEYELDTLTYYEVDDTLTDEKNTQIPSVDQTIGARHLHMFSKKTGTDKASLYVRNDEHQTLYEVILVEDSYARLILGMTEEELGLKPPKARPKKMKRDDY